MSRAALPDRRIRRRDGAVAAPALPAAPLPAEQLLALQRSAGNAAVARALAARSFDRAAYQRAMEAKAKFMAMLWAGPSWHPSTGRGNFDVLYEPLTGLLTVTVKCKFWFEDGKPDEWPLDDPEDLVWTPEAILKFKADFVRRVSAFWSDRFTFHCTRDWWEDLQAAVQVRFVESTEKDSHYSVKVRKIPDAGFKRSNVKPIKSTQMHGRSTLTSADLDQIDHGKHGEYSQVPAFHEAGHMLGLGDEYEEERTKKSGIPHEKLVKAEFGHGVPLHDDGRLMSEGDLIVPEYGVTFLEALRVITAMNEWHYDAKPPAPVLSEPMDVPLPPKQSPLAPGPPQIALA